MEQHVRQPGSICGEITPPADKSISHRSLILNSLADGQARVSNFLPAADCLSTLSCLRELGVEIDLNGEEVSINGAGKRGFFPPSRPLDAGNSGTTMRLMTGLLAAQPFESTLTGDDSLRSRPMERVIRPLKLMGANIRGTDSDTKAPLTIAPGELRGIHYVMPMASAQVKSAILIAGLAARGETVIEEPYPSRDHTERMLRAMGARIDSDGQVITLHPSPEPLEPCDITVPGDISSAAFWLVAGVIHPKANIIIKKTGINPTRNGIIEVLQSMGTGIIIENQQKEGDETVADLRVKSNQLTGTIINGDLIPRLIDEIPVIAVAAAIAKGTTTIRDAAELRVKESDRIQNTAAELSKMGADIEELPDGMIIRGVTGLKGATCDSHGDHRLAMALAVAGMIAEGETIISGAETVSISYPGFWDDLARLCD